MVIDPDGHLAFGAIGQHQAADDVDLPQRYRRPAFPAPVGAALAPPAARLDQAVAAQDAVHRRFPRRVLPFGVLPASSWALRRGPQCGCSRRSSHTRVSTSAEAWCGHDGGRCDRSINPASPDS